MKQSMKILLMQPPMTLKKSEIFGITPPLGLAYLASIAEQNDHNVKILDTLIEGYNNRSNENGYFRIGLRFDTIRQEVERFKPDLVGISCPFSLMDKEMRLLAAIIKNSDSDIPVVVGGAHPSSLPEYVIQDPNIDFVVVGEGEKTFLELIKKISEGKDYTNLKGILLKINGKIIKNPKRGFIKNLDTLPFPAWHLLPIEKYIQAGQVHGSQKRKRFMSMITSRGCPGRCVFCSIHSVWGYKWRARTPENIIKEIEKLFHKYKIREIHFEDDNLTLSKSRMTRICDLLVERDLDISWTTPNGVAIQTLDLNLLKKMKQSGCYQLSFGIESGDPYVLKNIIHKPLRLEKVNEVVKQSKNLGIWAHGYFVIGFPQESLDNIWRTITFAKKSDLDSASFFIATPYPGTELYSQERSVGLLKNSFDFQKLRTMDTMMDTTQFKAMNMIEIQKIAYFEFMKHRLRKEIFEGYILVRLAKIKSFDDIAFFLRKLRRLIRIFR